MLSLLPTPKLVHSRRGTLRFSEEKGVSIRAPGLARFVGQWLSECLRRDFAINARLYRPTTGPTIHLATMDDLVRDGLAEASWPASPAFASMAGREQGYHLDIAADRVVIGALSPPGLLYGAATLLQLLRPRTGEMVAPCGSVEDWPDFRFRSADWLLNAEINRWGYERGDGRDALLARMKRKLDLAARHKINVIWFDGFGWGTKRFPGYAEFCRELAACARDRHIRLAYSGYGGGYGFAYQKHFIYDAPYQGQLFENRTHYPHGEVYDCVGHPNYPMSWRYGTCLSNAALADLKIAEFVKFARECQPGLMYIHDIDTGNFDLAHAGWQRRCPKCRERWPDDDMASAGGAADAYASWFRRLAEAVNSVASEDGRYVATRDCALVFVGPVYTGCHEPDSTWLEECKYFGTVSRLMGPFPNVQFGLREQFVSDEPNGPRVPMLRDRLDAVGHGHGIFVIPFVGGDNYFSDQPVSAGPALHRHYLGADTVCTKTMGSVAEPAQLLCAEYGWNASAPGAFPIAPSRGDALALLKRCTGGVEIGSGIFGDTDLLSRACLRLYGDKAGRWMRELFALGAGKGIFPVLTGWGMVSRSVGRLLDPAGKDPGQEPGHWIQRAMMTTEAIRLVAKALAEPLPDAHVRADLEWLRTCLVVGKHLCDALAACWKWKGNPAAASHTESVAALNHLESCLNAHVPPNTTDPVGGDIAVWRATALKLRGLLMA